MSYRLSESDYSFTTALIMSLNTSNIKRIMERFKAEYGYKPNVYELIELYQQGELSLSGEEEDDVIRLMEAIE